MTIASPRAPAVLLRTSIVAEPAAARALSVYDPIVPPEIWLRTSTSVAAMDVLVRTNETIVAALSDALFIVIAPERVLRATPVDLLDACVTIPPAPVA